MNRKRMFWGALGLISLLLFLIPADSQAQKFLTRPIEFVCHAAPGGGSDIMARMMQTVIEKEKLCPQPVTVVNRPGGGGASSGVAVSGWRTPWPVPRGWRRGSTSSS